MKPSSACILIVDDEVGIRRLCGDVLRRSGYEAEAVADAAAALRRVESGLSGHAGRIALVISDVKMSPMDGLTFLRKLRTMAPALPVLLMTGYPTLETAVEGMQLGARNYITKPFKPSVLRQAVADVLGQVKGLRQRDSAAGIERLGAMVAGSASMKALFETIKRVAPTEATVLITGDSGTGKELVARAIHAQSARKAGPFVPVNCSALVDSLMESELFGHIKGAFTGASTRKAGLFEVASGGTLFLDEIGDLATSLQPKLLRVLQEGEIKPVGGVSAQPVDVRVVAATNHALQDAIDAGEFREDLYYRLNVFNFHIPPLRQRPEDILPIAQAFLMEFSERLGRTEALSLGAEAQHLLQNHSWPGNVRELRNTVLRAATLTTGTTVDAQALMMRPVVRRAQVPGGDQGPYIYDDMPLEQVERLHILHHLEKFGGNRSQTARVLGINRTTLWKKLSRYGIQTDS